MSSLWTPDGERPVGRPDGGSGGPPPGGGARRSGGPPPGPSAAGDEGFEEEWDEEELAQQVAAMGEELASAPVEVVVANHCYGLFQLAAVYLSQVPPLLDQARLAIDALGLLVTGLEHRLGESEDQLKEGLSQLRLAYVQIDGAHRAGADVVAGAGTNGGQVAGGPDGPTAAPPPDTDG